MNARRAVAAHEKRREPAPSDGATLADEDVDAILEAQALERAEERAHTGLEPMRGIYMGVCAGALIWTVLGLIAFFVLLT